MTIEQLNINDNPKLGSAVVETITKKLDEPKYQRLFDKSPSDKKLIKILHGLGYANKSIGSAFIHPKAKAYYKKYGEQYVECLEAALRLVDQ